MSSDHYNPKGVPVSSPPSLKSLSSLKSPLLPPPFLGFRTHRAPPHLIFAPMPAITSHIPRRHYHPERPRDYAALFERWLGHRLHPAPRRVIAHLERQRARRQHQRVFICTHPDHDLILRQALTDYLRWRMTVIDRYEQACVFARQSRDLKPFRFSDSTQLYSSRAPEKPRGSTFRIALILDADAYPDRGRYFSRVWRTVAPCMDFSHHSLLIVHGTYRPHTRVNPFTLRVRAIRHDRSLPLIDLTTPEPALPDISPSDNPTITEQSDHIPNQPSPTILNQIFSTPFLHLIPLT